MEIQQAQRELQARLIPLYGNREAAQIADWVMENITGLKKLDRIINKDLRLSLVQADVYWQYIKSLSNHQPVQYVLHESWFCGFKFYVDENVLIPRPETEELVEWARSAIEQRIANPASPQPDASPALLDIGTGSGCIAISLKKFLPTTRILACDLSPGALAVATRNAETLEAPIDFRQIDILDPQQRTPLPTLDYIISNPPYIPHRDKKAMSPHVLEHEPHLALFVRDEDPLVFYRAIAHLAKTHLAPQGAVFAELHEELAIPTQDLFLSLGFQNIEIRKDMQGKDRMIKATM